jgi:hypothetical protein
MCKFDNQSVQDLDNFELVRGNLEDLYEAALANCESVGVSSKNAIDDTALELRLSKLRAVPSLP